MPRTRPHLQRDAKVDELVAAAVRRLTEGGYQNLSVADIARELGLAQNAIYWYFPTKDHLFVAALHQIVDGILSKKPRGAGTFGRILWFTDRMQEFQSLRGALRERAVVSPVVAEFETNLHAGMRTLVIGALAETVPPTKLDVTTDAVMGLIEGVMFQGLPRKKRAEVLRFGLKLMAGVHD